VTSTGNTATVEAPTNTAGSFDYELVSVEDASSTSCSQNQTGIATVIVNPLPTATISGNTTVCKDDSGPTITFTGADGTAPYTFTYSINGGTAQTVTAIGNTATVQAPTGVAGDFDYELQSVVEGSGNTCSQNQTGTITVVVNPLPTATISGDITVCKDGDEPVLTFTGGNGTAPYTFTYSINGGIVQTITSTGNSATIQVPTSVVGSLDYELQAVEDGSGNPCSQNQTETAIVVVSPLPTATILGDTAICQNEPQPTITFTGADGATPYIFTYSINGGIAQTVTSTGNTAIVQVPTDTEGSFDYELQSVEEGSGNACSQNQTGIVTVIVNPLPTSSFMGTDLSGCSPICSELESTATVESPSSITNYDWTTSNGESYQSSQNTYELCLENNSSSTNFINVNLTVTTNEGCQDSDEENSMIEVYHNPIANFYTTPNEINVIDPQVEFHNTSSYADYYSWDIESYGISSDVSPTVVFPSHAGIYTIELIAYTDEGCRDSIIREIKVENQIIFYVPNTFTPDTDNYNETFQPVFTSGYDPNDFSLEIYNRWGELIFESHNADIGWDGTYGGRIAQDGTYVWKIEFKETISTERRKKMGKVNLIR
jgi:gliding motility-associated-like protein